MYACRRATRSVSAARRASGNAGDLAELAAGELDGIEAREEVVEEVFGGKRVAELDFVERKRLG